MCSMHRMFTFTISFSKKKNTTKIISWEHISFYILVVLVYGKKKKKVLEL